MKRHIHWSVCLFLVSFSCLGSPVLAEALSSWRDTGAKRSITAFVERVTKEGTAEYIPPSERVATFEHDGTLWVEKPAYVQLVFAIDRVKAMAPRHPEWNDKEPFASLLEGDMKSALAGGEHAVLEIVMPTHAGMTTEAFEKTVKDWLAAAKHPTTNRALHRDGVSAHAGAARLSS